MKTILYATDYSQNSVAALKLSQLLAKKFDSKFILLHIFDMPLSLASPISISHLNKEKQLYIENSAKLKAFYRQHLGDNVEREDTHFAVEENASVWSAILEKATSFGADMIVTGTKGASPIKEFILGSTTKALIRKAACPVLAVPPGFHALNFSTITYASDFELADIYAIRRLVEFAGKFDARIRIVHITTKKVYDEERQMEWFKAMVKQKVQYKKMEFDALFGDSVIDALNRYLDHSGTDLLAMLEREDDDLFSKLFHKDTVLKMEDRSNIPLLSYNTGRF